MFNVKYPYHLLLIVILCFITRIPQLASPHLFLDGDECLSGIMAKHVYQLQDLPLYFWGQRYGLSLIEILFILPFYAALGINTIAVKLAMLSLWTIGVCFLYKLLLSLSEKKTYLPLLLIALFICLPAWGVWSMKARGGYLTAFTISNILLWLLFSPAYNRRLLTYIWAGLLLCVVYEAQRFWLAGVIPLAGYALYKQKNSYHILALAASFTIPALGFYWYKLHLYSFLETTITMPHLSDIGSLIARLPEYLFITFHGHYYFQYAQTPDVWSAICAIACCLICISLVALAGYQFLIRKRGNMLFVISVLAIPALLFVTFFFAEIHGHYLLPTSGFMLISLQLYLSSMRISRMHLAIFTGLLISGFIAMINFYSFQFLDGRKKLISNLIYQLKNNRIHHVFSHDNMLAWEISFYTNEDIICRMPGCHGRYLHYTEMVNNAQASGKPTALIYRYWEKETQHFFFPSTRSGMYNIVFYPRTSMLKQAFCMP